MEIFQYFDQFNTLSEKAKFALKAITKEISYKKNEVIQQAGNSCKTIYFVKEGITRIFYYKDGNDITEHFAFPSDVIVRAESLFTGKPTQKSIEAIESTEIIAIDSAKMFGLYDQHHDLERLFRLIFEREYVNAIKRLESLQFKNATERYSELLDKTDFVQKIPLKYIASYLGITQVSLSRIRAAL